MTSYINNEAGKTILSQQRDTELDIPKQIYTTAFINSSFIYVTQ